MPQVLDPPPETVGVESNRFRNRFLFALWRTREWLADVVDSLLSFLGRHSLFGITTSLVFLFFIFYFWQRIFISIHSGEDGVLWRRFMGGTELERTYGEGLQIIAPWDIMYIYDIRFREFKETVRLLTQDGLQVDVDLAIRARPELSRLGYLHRRIGPDYMNIVVLPQVISAARAVLSGYEPEQLYLARPEKLEDDILKLSRDESFLDLVDVDQVNILRISLPQRVQAAVQRKYEEEEALLTYEFTLKKEEKEAQRKAIEAKGIKDFNDITGRDMTEQYLKWKALEVSRDLANSPNAKIVVFGTGKDGLPVLLGNEIGTTGSK